MFTSSEKFLRIQQQFQEYTSFEQLSTIVELTRSLQISYQHFLMQLLQINVQNENDVMFNHTVDDANSPDIVTCLLSNKNLDKVLITLQLYLPLISTKTLNEKLLNAYRDVLIYLDKNLSPTKLTHSDEKLINIVQQIFFFIHINPNLQILLSHIPKLIYLIQTKTFHSEHQTLQRHPSIRSQVQPLMTFASESSSNSQISQQLTRHETNDSGVDLSDPSITNPMHNLLSKNSYLERNLSSQKKHSFVGKTASSPIPEHATLDVPVRVPLKGVLSAPPATSDRRQQSSIYQRSKHISTLAKSDEEEEDEQESQKQIDALISGTNNSTDNSKPPLGQFYSLRYRNIRNSNTEDVSQYLGVDANSAPVRNTFMQSNTGMKDVPRWLKHLRLHKYEAFFSQITYDEMMNLTNEKLKAVCITEGACSKIILNIKKLKERSIVLKQYLIDLDNEQIDLQNLILQLSEIMMTPILTKQLTNENQTEEDLPKLIVEVLEKILQQLPSHAPVDTYRKLLSLVDCCYRHEAFNEYADRFLQWRRRLSNALQSFAKIDYKPNQPIFGQQRRSIKPSVRPMKTFSAAHHPNYPSNSIPLAKYNSEPQNNQFIDPSLIRRPNRSPTLMYPTNEESTPPTNHGAYLANHQHQALTRKASIDPHGENNVHNRTKLCQTYSDPHKVRFQNFQQTNHIQSSNRSQQNLIRMVSTPYSQQQRPFISRSPPAPTMDTLAVSPIQKSYSDNENLEYYRNTNNTMSFSNPNDTENSDDQRHSNADLELMCRQITENALSDDVNDSSMDYKEESSNIKPSVNNPTDMEQ